MERSKKILLKELIQTDISSLFFRRHHLAHPTIVLSQYIAYTKAQRTLVIEAFSKLIHAAVLLQIPKSVLLLVEQELVHGGVSIRIVLQEETVSYIIYQQ